MYMKTILAITVLAASAWLHAADVDPRISAIAEKLNKTEAYTDSARFVMAMESMSNDVAYDIALHQKAAPADTLSPCSYIVRWNAADRGRSGGFTAYFDGNIYSHTGGNRRMAEFHADTDTTVFRPSNPSAGMQQTAQFANLLPAFIGAELKKMAADPECSLRLTTDTVVGGRRMQAISAVHARGGLTARTLRYVLDPETSLPISMEIVNNPGSDSEQSISVVYSGSPALKCGEISEESLAAMFPDAFTRYRRGRMDVRRLTGHVLPGFSLPTTTGERYTRENGDSFRRPTVVALIDDTAPEAAATVTNLREAIARADSPADLIMAFTGNNVDRIEALAPDIRPGEHLLISARGLARDLGAAALPTIIVCDSEANVGAVLTGFNNTQSSDVIKAIDNEN